LPRFFHVDGQRALTAGQVIQLTDLAQGFGAGPLQDHARWWFPDGVTEQGRKYLLAPDASLSIRTHMQNNHLPPECIDHVNESTIEMVFEYVRRAYFQARPSRLASFFAWKTLQEAKRFRDRPERRTAVIWRVEGEQALRADMWSKHMTRSLALFSVGPTRRAVAVETVPFS